VTKFEAHKKIEECFRDFDVVQEAIKAGMVLPPSEEYYTVKLRALRIYTEVLAKPDPDCEWCGERGTPLCKDCYSLGRRNKETK
jgi:hypothetical protein